MQIDRSKFLSLCFSMVPAIAVACGGTGNDSTAAGGSDLSGPVATPSPAAPAAAAPAVTVNTTTITNGNCKEDVKAPTVSIPTNKAAENAINDALAKFSANPCGESIAAVQSDFEVTANAEGLLSIRVAGNVSFVGEDQPHSFFETFNFDVKNGGKQLHLPDVLTAAGVAKEHASCITTLNTDFGDTTSPVEESIGGRECNSLFDPSVPFDPAWVATAKGLEIEVTVSHPGDFLGSPAPWSDLVTDGLQNTVVAAFGKAQK
jgi:hypothetical protein